MVDQADLMAKVVPVAHGAVVVLVVPEDQVAPMVLRVKILVPAVLVSFVDREEDQAAREEGIEVQRVGAVVLASEHEMFAWLPPCSKRPVSLKKPKRFAN